MGIFSKTGDVSRMTKSSSIPKFSWQDVALRLEALRKSVNIDKGDFALSCGLDPSSYSKILSATKPLKSEHAYAIAQQWGVTMDFLYSGDLSRIDDRLRSTIISHLNAPTA